MSEARRSRTTPGRSWKGLIRDYLSYALIGAACIVAIGLLGLSAESTEEVEHGFKWLAFAAVTALAFVTEVQSSRHRWRIPKFWHLLGVALTVQCAVGVVILSAVGTVQPLLWGLVYVLNCSVLGAFVDFSMGSTRR